MVAQPVMSAKLKFLNCSGDGGRLFEDGWPRAALKARTRKLRGANCPPRGLKTVYAKAKGTPSGIKSSLLSLCQYLCQYLYFCTSNQVNWVPFIDALWGDLEPKEALAQAPLHSQFEAEDLRDVLCGAAD